MGIKNDEIRCLNKTIEYINSICGTKVEKYINSVIPIKNINSFDIKEQERPDFVLRKDDCAYGIEHFMVDFCYDGINNNQSKSKLSRRDSRDIYHKYHNDEVGLENEDVENARKDMEKFINHNSNISLSFEYDRFVDGFKKAFDKHYTKIDEYKENSFLKGICNKMGFLIEFHCDTFMINAYIDGNPIYFRNTKNMPFPLTKDIVNIFRKADKLDFIILSQFSEGIESDARSVLVFEPQNIDESLKKQRLKIYDKVGYYKIEKKVKLYIE